MLEQPFPALDWSNPSNKEEIVQWKNVKELYQQLGIFVCADESVSTEKDLDYIKVYPSQFIHNLILAGYLRYGECEIR